MGHQDAPQPLPLSAAEPAAAVGVGEEVAIALQHPVELLEKDAVDGGTNDSSGNTSFRKCSRDLESIST